LSERFVPTEDLRLAAQVFTKASKDSLMTLKHLEETIKHLEEKWVGSTGQIFFKHYASFRPQMEGAVAHMDLIARELEAIADRYEAADS
jgi:WXG100 family type VII secretion target